jgi:hypothetical protein
MQPSATFLSLCGRSFALWLLANTLGAALVYLKDYILIPNATDSFVLALGTSIVAWAVLCYSAALWPFLFFMPHLWALSADQPKERRVRLLLAILAPFSLLAASQTTAITYGPLEFTGCYLLACLLVGSLVFRRWLW